MTDELFDLGDFFGGETVGNWRKKKYKMFSGRSFSILTSKWITRYVWVACRLTCYRCDTSSLACVLCVFRVGIVRSFFIIALYFPTVSTLYCMSFYFPGVLFPLGFPYVLSSVPSRCSYRSSRCSCCQCTPFKLTLRGEPTEQRTRPPATRWSATNALLGHICAKAARRRARPSVHPVPRGRSRSCGTTSPSVCAVECAARTRWWRRRVPPTLTASASVRRGTTSRRTTTCVSPTASVRPGKECWLEVGCCSDVVLKREMN